MQDSLTPHLIVSITLFNVSHDGLISKFKLSVHLSLFMVNIFANLFEPSSSSDNILFFLQHSVNFFELVLNYLRVILATLNMFTLVIERLKAPSTELASEYKSS